MTMWTRASCTTPACTTSTYAGPFCRHAPSWCMSSTLPPLTYLHGPTRTLYTSRGTCTSRYVLSCFKMSEYGYLNYRFDAFMYSLQTDTNVGIARDSRSILDWVANGAEVTRDELLQFVRRAYTTARCKFRAKCKGTRLSVLVRERGEGRRHARAWCVSAGLTSEGTHRTRWGRTGRPPARSPGGRLYSKIGF